MPPERTGRGVPPGGGAGGPARQFCPPTPGDSRGAPGPRRIPKDPDPTPRVKVLRQHALQARISNNLI